MLDGTGLLVLVPLGSSNVFTDNQVRWTVDSGQGTVLTPVSARCEEHVSFLLHWLIFMLTCRCQLCLSGGAKAVDSFFQSRWLTCHSASSAEQAQNRCHLAAVQAQDPTDRHSGGLPRGGMDDVRRIDGHIPSIDLRNVASCLKFNPSIVFLAMMLEFQHVFRLPHRHV